MRQPLSPDMTRTNLDCSSYVSPIYPEVPEDVDSDLDFLANLKTKSPPKSRSKSKSKSKSRSKSTSKTSRHTRHSSFLPSKRGFSDSSNGHSRSKSFIQLTHNDSLIPNFSQTFTHVDSIPSPTASSTNASSPSSFLSAPCCTSPTTNLFRGVVGIDSVNKSINHDHEQTRPFDADDVMSSIRRNHEKERTKSILSRRPSLDMKIVSKPSLIERLQKFESARVKRTLKYGKTHALGLLNTFDYLSGVRSDVDNVI
ncbi:hypothetical protein TrST_g5000 [Triparma strigata]|uniref:Uncharacterized protein n=1 Tax=Triparma strigata TaxID=1606541 RepID=A0A9W7ASA3_9STRA|nr:hypothetical protein TrST_g5000 [Triparma strigata]